MCLTNYVGVQPNIIWFSKCVTHFELGLLVLLNVGFPQITSIHHCVYVGDMILLCLVWFKRILFITRHDKRMGRAKSYV